MLYSYLLKFEYLQKKNTHNVLGFSINKLKYKKENKRYLFGLLLIKQKLIKPRLKKKPKLYKKKKKRSILLKNRNTFKLRIKKPIFFLKNIKKLKYFFTKQKLFNIAIKIKTPNFNIPFEKFSSEKKISKFNTQCKIIQKIKK